MFNILKAIYEFLKEKKANERGTIYFDTTTNTITIEGGNVTVAELYKHMQEALKDATSIKTFEIKE